MLELGAHAAYRAAQNSADQAAAVKRIDDIVRAYTDVVRVTPGDENAAWNLEFVSRVRAQFAQSRQPAFPEPETARPGRRPAARPDAARRARRAAAAAPT